MASRVSRAGGQAPGAVTARIAPSLIATSAGKEAVSVTRVAPVMTRSAWVMVGSLSSPRGRGEGSGCGPAAGASERE